ncbi:response regulator transcription factor [Novosphingobium profundi]|uniref:response regulator n=1 Tax=Novosphingobium profundi TaxID=1774954 RepID=UPI001BDA3182|nr:response regulator transcription factor [Novosphingobium profundi]MBT0667418.1 response regulator transcription factor [Novosphingobium profundi]
MVSPDNVERATVAILEDDPEIRELVTMLLEREGYEVLVFETSKELAAKGVLERIDCLILDLMLPGEDGLTICRSLRGDYPGLPILIVTAKSDPVDRIVGLELGADDYLAKPFNSRELLARLRSILRRTRELTRDRLGEVGTGLAFEGWLLRVDAHELIDPEGHAVALTTGEFDLLHVLASHPQRVLSREFLIDATRGHGATPLDRVIDVQIGRLRRKLGGAVQGTPLIRTVRGDGYVFSPRVKPC